MQPGTNQFQNASNIAKNTVSGLVNKSEIAPLMKLKALGDPLSAIGLSNETKLGKFVSDSFLKSFRTIAKNPGLRKGLLALPAIIPISYMKNMGKYKNMITNYFSKAASYIVEEIDCGNTLSKHASNSRQIVSEIMDKIYKEDPSYWPYGLSIPGHTNVYLIKDASTNEPVGFVGWQEIKREGKKVGSYSIGILPEYRNKGFAKEAVAKVIREKAAGVDEVRSYVCPHNYRSKGLANSLHINIQEKF